MALILTFAAGFVDVVGLLTIYKLFTAHMTGTTVHLGQQLSQRNWPAAAAAASVVAAFLLGSIFGRVVIELGAEAGLRRVASITFVLEGILLISVALWGGESLPKRGSGAEALGIVCPLLSLMAGAMGLQTATLTRIGPLTIHTTFVTGMLNKLAQLVSRWLFLTREIYWNGNARTDALRKKRTIASRQAKLILAIWMLYLGGAVCGTWAARHWQLRSLYIPCLLLLLAIFVDQAYPLSLEEEQAQLQP